MGYNDTINELKAALSAYSDEESKLMSLYETALTNAEKAYSLANKQLDEQYDRDRNEVYADTAREERNALNMIASRGLGFSGEAAQAKLNSGITLANRLGELTRGKNNQSLDLERDYLERKTALSIENADKIGDINQKRNDTLKDIAGMELDKEQHDAALRADAKLQAEKLKHDRDMKQLELDTKYGGNGSDVTVNGGNVSVGGSDEKEDTKADGFLPDISPKDLAKQVIASATGDTGAVTSDEHSYAVNKYLLELIDNYDMNDEYYDELVFMLRAYGYDVPEEKDMRADVISTDAKEYYNDRYGYYYDQYILAGADEKTSRSSAKTDAMNAMLKYIFDSSKSESDFRYYCAAAHISQKQVDEYLSIHEFEPVYDTIQGGAGKIKTNMTRMTR